MAEIVSKRFMHSRDARIAGLYDLEYTIGQGHFAIVKLARHVFTGNQEAYLRMHDSSPTDDHVVQGHEHVLEYEELTKRALELRRAFRIAEGMADRHQFLETIKSIASSIEAVGSY